MASATTLLRFYGGCFQMLRNHSARCLPIWFSQRKFTDQTYENVTVHRDKDIKELGIVTMTRKPVNSLNKDLLVDLAQAFKFLSGDETIKAMILTSVFPGNFCAGLDLMSIYKRTYEDVYDFWYALQNMWLNLYGNRLYTVAVVNGHAPAAGCVLAISCDYRVMAEGKCFIGLNETRVDLVVPYWAKDAMINVVGYGAAERSLMLGTLYPAQKALEMGLVDQVLPMDQIMDAAKANIREALKVPAHARELTKLSLLRKETLERLSSRQPEDADYMATFITSTGAQQGIEVYLEGLTKRKSSR